MFISCHQNVVRMKGNQKTTVKIEITFTKKLRAD